MKKVLFTFIMVLATQFAYAQATENLGSWEHTRTEADELKGQEASDVLIYTVAGMGSLVCWGFEEFQFRLVSSETQFDIDAGYGHYVGSYAGVNIYVGIYTKEGKLVEKFKMWLDREDNHANRFVRTRNAGSMSNPVGQKGKVKKIFKALKSGSDKKVRIVAPRYNTTDFDITLTPID
ncbi:MAG: hypothetical protein IJ742_00120 [Prevotella sp.]|nr:hypothetical protein [Prevotella sp.]